MIDVDSGETLKVFNSLSDAGRYLNKNTSNISTSINTDVQQTAHGYKWKYCDN